MRRVRMRSSGERRTPVATFEDTVKRSGCEVAKTPGERESARVEKKCVNVECIIGWRDESRKALTQNVAVPKINKNVQRFRMHRVSTHYD